MSPARCIVKSVIGLFVLAIHVPVANGLADGRMLDELVIPSDSQSDETSLLAIQVLMANGLADGRLLDARVVADERQSEETSRNASAPETSNQRPSPPVRFQQKRLGKTPLEARRFKYTPRAKLVAKPRFDFNASAADNAGVTANQYGDGSAFLWTALYSSAGASFLMCTFFLLRSFFPIVYCRITLDEVDSEDDPPIAVSWWSWLTGSDFDREATACDLIHGVGLDGWMFLEFFDLCKRMLLRLGFVVVLVLCPLNYYYGLERKLASDKVLAWDDNITEGGAKAQILGSFSWLAMVSLDNLEFGSDVFWVHAVFVWIVVLSFRWFVLDTHQRFLEQRFKWLEALPAPRSTTVMVEMIPEKYRSDKELLAFFQRAWNRERIGGEEVVTKAYVVRQTRVLKRKVRAAEAARAAMKTYEDRWESVGSPAALSAQVEARKKTWQDAHAALGEERERVEKGAQVGDPSICSGSGFVTCSSRTWQRVVAKEQYTHDQLEFVMRLPPDPSDVIFEDLMESDTHSFYRESFGYGCLALIFIVWTPLVALVSAVTSLEAFEGYLPAITPFLENHASANVLLKGVFASAALKLLMAILPMFVLCIIRAFFCLKGGAWAQLRMEEWLFAFNLIFVLLVTSLAGSLYGTIQLIIKNPVGVFDLLASGLPNASHFYLNYIVVSWATIVIELLRIANVAKYLVYRYCFGLNPEEAKASSEPEDESGYGLGARTSVAVLMLTVTMVYCTICPVIMPVAWVYFYIGRRTYGYLLKRAEEKKPDLGGYFWVNSVWQAFFGVTLYIVLMFALLSSRSNQRGPQIIAISALVPHYFAFSRFTHYDWETLPFARFSKAQEAQKGLRKDFYEDHHISELTAEYVQPECRPETAGW